MKKIVKKLSDCFNPSDIDSLMSKDSMSIDLGDSLGNFSQKGNEPLFLNRFKESDFYRIISCVGLEESLAKKGFTDLLVTISVDESKISYLRIYHDKAIPENLLIDLRLSESKFVPDSKYFEDKDQIVTYDMIRIEWLSAHNPLEDFCEVRPQLPGQKSPGLGILKYCFEMMRIVGNEISRDGFIDVPDHIHGAIMYSKRFKFFDPRMQGILKAVMRDLKDYSLCDISWGFITNTIIENYKQEPQDYTPTEQIYYLSEKLRSYFHSKMYKETYQKYYKVKKYTFDFEEMQKRRNTILMQKSVSDL